MVNRTKVDARIRRSHLHKYKSVEPEGKFFGVNFCSQKWRSDGGNEDDEFWKLMEVECCGNIGGCHF